MLLDTSDPHLGELDRRRWWVDDRAEGVYRCASSICQAVCRTPGCFKQHNSMTTLDGLADAFLIHLAGTSASNPTGCVVTSIAGITVEQARQRIRARGGRALAERVVPVFRGEAQLAVRARRIMRLLQDRLGGRAALPQVLLLRSFQVSRHTEYKPYMPTSVATQFCSCASCSADMCLLAMLTLASPWPAQALSHIKTSCSYASGLVARAYSIAEV